VYQGNGAFNAAQQAAARGRRYRVLIALPLLIVLCGILTGTTQAPVPTAAATATATATHDLQPTDRQRRVSKLVGNVMERAHYRKSPINDPVSSLMLDRYLESLDGTKSYFLASDIADFEQYRYRLDDAIQTGALEPVFTIFNRFQQRIANASPTRWNC